MKITLPAQPYHFTPDFWVVTSYYNPCAYETRRQNYDTFADTLRSSGIPLLTVECAFGNRPFTLPVSPTVVQLRSQSVVWQKERLLNLAVSWLPRSCRYVAWLDCDLVFCNPAWASMTSRLLDTTPLVQVFESCVRLPKGNRRDTGNEDAVRSFAAITPQNPAVMQTGRFDDHGHTGYGWAARRELLDSCGLYEFAIAGSADHYMAHAAMGDLDGICIRRMMCNDAHMLRHFREWGERFADAVNGDLTAVPGEALHLWHGELKDRKYLQRHYEVAEVGFNPYTDLDAPPGKPLEWRRTHGTSGLRELFTRYFAGRNEDGGLAVTA